MVYEFSRAEILLGAEGLKKLSSKKVAIFGIGGVGSYVVEALARCGVGHFVLIDSDHVCVTNINRQIHATQKTIGKPKVEVMKDRIIEINPKAEVLALEKFYTPDTARELLDKDYNYIVDAVDTVTAKIDLVVKAKQMGIPIISSMGAGNKMNPDMFRIADIYSTSVDPLARVMRKELKKRGIESLKVVYSKEQPLKSEIIGSLSFVPSVAGLIMAGEVIKDLVDINNID